MVNNKSVAIMLATIVVVLYNASSGFAYSTVELSASSDIESDGVVILYDDQGKHHATLYYHQKVHALFLCEDDRQHTKYCLGSELIALPFFIHIRPENNYSVRTLAVKTLFDDASSFSVVDRFPRDIEVEDVTTWNLDFNADAKVGNIVESSIEVTGDVSITTMESKITSWSTSSFVQWIFTEMKDDSISAEMLVVGYLDRGRDGASLLPLVVEVEWSTNMQRRLSSLVLDSAQLYVTVRRPEVPSRGVK